MNQSQDMDMTEANSPQEALWIDTKDAGRVLRRGDLFRVVRDVVADVLSKMRREDSFSLGVAVWSPETQLKDTGLSLGSMERVSVAQALTDFFQLRDYGYEDYLLSAQKIDDWLNLIALSLQHTGQNLVFQTSGTTGDPKQITHQLQNLRREVRFWADIILDTKKPTVQRLVSLVPANHIFGFLWTALLPATLDVAVIDKRLSLPTSVIGALQPGDFIVAVPSQWQSLADLGQSFEGVGGVNAAGPLDQVVWRGLADKGLDLIDVYGSTETGAIGYRRDPAAAYDLMPYWQVGPGGDCLVPADSEAGQVDVALPDHLEVLGEGRQIKLAGRRDGAVSVHGTNVDPSVVRDIFVDLDDVRDCAVRLSSDGASLKMFVATDVDETGQASLREVIRNVAQQKLPSAARPAVISFGKRLPVNEMGKLMDWPGE